MQGTDDWLKMRLGKVTGSRIKDVLSKGRGSKPSLTRKSYIYELVAERLCTEPKEQTRARSLAWGNDVEQYAREAYEIKSGNIVKQVDFIDHKTIPWVGCSPDGLVNGVGGVEMKCPYDPAVHIKTIAEGMDPDHMPQVQFNMWVCEWQWCDFISYDPRIQSEHLRLYIERIKPDEEFVQEMKQKLSVFLQETDAVYRSLINDKQGERQ